MGGRVREGEQRGGRSNTIENTQSQRHNRDRAAQAKQSAMRHARRGGTVKGTRSPKGNGL